MKPVPGGPSWSAAWGTVAVVAGGGAAAVGLDALPPGWKFPAWLAWMLGALTLAALCLCIASLLIRQPPDDRNGNSGVIAAAPLEPQYINVFFEQEGDQIFIGLRNDGPAVEVLAQVIKALNPLGHPIGQQNWPIPWHEDYSVESKWLLCGQTRKLNFARYDDAAVNNELSTGCRDTDHWQFPSVPVSIGGRYINPRSRKDLEDQRFYLTVRIMNASTESYNDWNVTLIRQGIKCICELTPARRPANPEDLNTVS